LDIKILALKLVKNPQKGTITELALLSEEGKPIKTWGIYGKISLIIGKNTMKSHADVDLKNTAFSSLVDPEHAVLNYADNNWYLEDNDSRNGISIVKNGDKKRYYISKREPVIIEMGDIVYIANTRLLVR
jgi:pSer/pThr/pTyr-binding forkhead associated (FHA) protein